VPRAAWRLLLFLLSPARQEYGLRFYPRMLEDFFRFAVVPHFQCLQRVVDRVEQDGAEFRSFHHFLLIN